MNPIYRNKQPDPRPADILSSARREKPEVKESEASRVALVANKASLISNIPLECREEVYAYLVIVTRGCFLSVVQIKNKERSSFYICMKRLISSFQKKY